MSTKSTVVVIVNYNTSQQVVNAIQSLSTEDVEAIVVVDNFSPNDNLNRIEDLNSVKKVVLVRNGSNVGFGEACNIGVEYASQHFSPEYILFLNPDTWVEEGCVQRLKAAFNESKVGISTPLITSMNDKNKIWYSGGQFSWLRGSALVEEYGFDLKDKPLALMSRDVEFATGCCFLIRSAIFKNIKGFDSRYFMYEEDVDLSLKILKQGLLIRYIPDAVVRHIGQGSQGELGNNYSMYDPQNPKLTFFVYYTTRNRFFTVHKHGNLVQRATFYVGFPIWIVRRGMPWLLHGRFDAFKALYKAMKNALIN